MEEAATNTSAKKKIKEKEIERNPMVGLAEEMVLFSDKRGGGGGIGGFILPAAERERETRRRKNSR